MIDNKWKWKCMNKNAKKTNVYFFEIFLKFFGFNSADILF